jgi:thymidine phosphorylase
MIITVDLHLRTNPQDEHRNLGLVAVEHDGNRVAPHDDIACVAGDRLVRAHITAVRQQGDHLPHVYADEVSADEEVR